MKRCFAFCPQFFVVSLFYCFVAFVVLMWSLVLHVHKSLAKLDAHGCLKGSVAHISKKRIRDRDVDRQPAFYAV